MYSHKRAKSAIFAPVSLIFTPFGAPKMLKIDLGAFKHHMNFNHLSELCKIPKYEINP